jgi:hypothetical protein
LYLRLKILFTVIIAVYISSLCLAQTGSSGIIGGNKVASNAFVGSLGGYLSSSLQAEAGLFLQNPAIADTSANASLQLSIQPLWGQSVGMHLMGEKYLKNKKTVHISLQNIHFGNLQGTDIFGNPTSNFNVNEFAFTAGLSQKIKTISAGFNLKLLGNSFPSKQYLALAADLGAQYLHPEGRFSGGLVFSNLGTYLGKREVLPIPELPFMLKAGISYKPKYMSIRFHLQLHHLHQLNNAYILEPEEQTGSFSSNTPRNTILKKALQHANLGVELLVHKNIRLNVSFNQLIRSELKQSNISGTSGLAAGIFFTTKKINLGFSHQSYHWSGGLTTFSLNKKIK